MALSSKLKKQLYNLYFDPRSPTAYKSKAKLIAAAGKLGISKRTVLEFLINQPAYSAYKPVRVRNVPSRFYNVYGPNKLAECDLLDVSALAPYQDKKNINFLLMCIDGFTKKIFVRPLASRASSDVTRAMKSIVKENKNRIWDVIRVDEGSEFKGMFKKFVESRGSRITFALTSAHKAAMVERTNLTLRTLLAKFLEKRGSLKYYDKLDALVKGHNNSISASHGFKPSQIRARDIFHIWSQRYLKKLPVYYPSNLKPGVQVRIFRKFGTFEKKSGRKFTNEIFTIYQVFRKNNIDMLQLIDNKGRLIQGLFYPHEVSRSASNET